MIFPSPLTLVLTPKINLKCCAFRLSSDPFGVCQLVSSLPLLLKLSPGISSKI